MKVRWSQLTGALCAVLILALIEFCLARPTWPYRYLRSSYVGEFLTIEESLAVNKVPPRIVILGNSRSRVGLQPAVIEQTLQLPSGSVLNLSLSSGDHYDNTLMYEKHADVLKQAHLILYAVDAYQWNASSTLTERFYHFASFKDRWELCRTPEGLIGFFLRTVNKSALFRSAALELAGELRTRLAPVTAKADVGVSAESVEHRVAYWYDSFEISTPRDRLLRNLIQQTKLNGQEFIIVQFPFRDAYVQELGRAHASAYRQYLACLRDLPVDRMLIYDRASGCGLSDADVRDWDHLNERGAAAFSKVLAEALKTGRTKMP